MKLSDLFKRMPSAEIKSANRDDVLVKYMGANFLVSRDKFAEDKGYLVTDLPVYPIHPTNLREAEKIRKAFKDYELDEVHLHPKQHEAHIHITKKMELTDVPAELEKILSIRADLNRSLNRWHPIQKAMKYAH